MKEILEILQKDSRTTPEQIAQMLSMSVADVKNMIKQMEDEKIIAGYTTIINWDKTESESVTALIEVKVVPTRGQGFDRVASRIYNFPEVKTLYLMSGGFDFLVVVEGKTIKDIAHFISEKLATLEYVTGTASHFVLKKYKNEGVILNDKIVDDREMITI